ncbi:hypothetical protein DFS33DRAFT_962548 [Desarmillaria ectypa]|nr:hypothetical protein DFS33DRAFT_962548 [Desarmillaria ectypa]
MRNTYHACTTMTRRAVINLWISVDCLSSFLLLRGAVLCRLVMPTKATGHLIISLLLCWLDMAIADLLLRRSPLFSTRGKSSSIRPQNLVQNRPSARDQARRQKAASLQAEAAIVNITRHILSTRLGSSRGKQSSYACWDVRASTSISLQSV